MSRMAPARTKSAATTPRPGLRERKKIRTRQAIRHAAYRLFAEQGYDATSVDRIAHEAEVSPSTVFRYFPTKEDIVLTDEYDPLIHDALLARPADEAPVTALRNAMLGIFEQAARQEPGREPAESHQRMQLVLNVPALRARMTEHMAVTGRLLVRALAERTGLPTDSFELRVCTGALLGAMAEAMFLWGEGGSEEEMIGAVDRALRLLESGLNSAMSAPAPRDRQSARRK
jgi:AcrR family transcriptional regulator